MNSIFLVPDEAVSPLPLPYVSEPAADHTIEKPCAPTSDSARYNASDLEQILNRDSSPMHLKLATVVNKSLGMTLGLLHDVIFVYRLMRHPNTPWPAKALLSVPVMYLCSPIQVFPSFIPILGQVDDVFVIWVAKKLATKFVDVETRRECRAAATEAKLPHWLRMPEDNTNRTGPSRICGLDPT